MTDHNTANHSYNTPARGTLDWDTLLNDNFARLERDVPVYDTETNRDSYAPYDGSVFVATDTGRRYVGDGTAWSELPYPSSDTSSGSTDDSGSTSSDANVTVSKANGTIEAARDGTTFSSSSDADVVFDDLVNALQDGDTVSIGQGVYTISDMKIIGGVTGLTWHSEGTVVLNDGGNRVPGMFRFSNCSNLLVDGGTYDYDYTNNYDDGSPGTQFVLSLWNPVGVEIRNTTLLNAQDGFIGGAAQDIVIHHNTMDTSGERGMYLANDTANVEIHNNDITNVASGVLRGEDGSSGWYSHDNYFTTMETSERGVGPVYLFGTGPHDLTFERDVCVMEGYGYAGYFRGTFDGVGPNNITVTDCEFRGKTGSDLKFLEFTDNPDMNSMDISNNTLDNVENTIDVK
ncbi:hypothetical protein [Salinigranum sp.]|uniref:hypothetical protein n=1 Tax=Salinigranum sp. TaxID=1966351 RepID=UPI00356A031B